MTTTTLGIIVGWIVVLGFAATIVITLLALIGYLPQVKEKYLGRLFVLVVVELASAGFWLFNQTFQPPEPPELAFQPPLPAEVYVFGRDGEPVQRTDLMLGDITERTFNETKVTFDVPRKLELTPTGDSLLVTSQRTNDRLGIIRFDDLSDEMIDKVTPIARHLALGHYYADCLDFPTCKQRRNPFKAVSRLTWVLASEQSDLNQQESAALRLFHLQRYFRSCETFQLLANKLKQYRREDNRYAEIGDIYEYMGQVIDLNSVQRKAVYLQSLKYLLRFLGSRSVNPGTDFFQRVVRQTTDLAQYLGLTDTTLLLGEVTDELSSRSEDQNSQPLPARLQNRLGVASDNIEETFQCPA